MGHRKKCVGALQSTYVNLQFSGEQPIMHDLQITEGCLGTFSPKLNVGDIQKMYFQPTNQGPFYFSDHEKEFCHFDQNLNGSTPKTKKHETIKERIAGSWCSCAFEPDATSRSPHPCTSTRNLNNNQKTKCAPRLGRQIKRYPANPLGVWVD